MNRKMRRAREARERSLEGRVAAALREAKAAADAHDPEHYKTTTARALIEADRKFRSLRDRAIRKHRSTW